MRCFFEPPAADWMEGHAETDRAVERELLPAERAWWSRLSSGVSPLVCAARPSLPDSFWETVVMVDNSPVSQFDVLVNGIRDGLDFPDRLACLAATGSGFHGNRQRPWHALRGNLHLTTFCRLELEAAKCGAALSMLPTLAVTDVLRPRLGDRCWIKWVNDVYVGEAKVSGSLVSTEVENDLIRSLVLGVGVNVGTTPALDGRPGFVSRATCLSESAGDFSLEEVTRALLAALSGRITQLCAEGPEGLQRDYLARAGVIGREGSLFPEFADSPDEASPLASGRILAVHPDLSLEFAGHTGRFQSGRLLLTIGGEPSA